MENDNGCGFLIGIVGVFFAVGYLLMGLGWLIRHPEISIPVALVLVGLIVWGRVWYLADQKRKQLAHEQNHQQELQAKKDRINDLRMKVAGLLTESLFIDANIWMMDYEEWFKVQDVYPEYLHSQDLFSDILPQSCRENGYVITLPSWQFDEICNVKKRSAYGEESNKSSRVAIGRVEELQKLGLLRIENITLKAQNAYADPLIIQGAIEAVKAGRNTTVVTNDKELRIRLRQHLTDTGLDNWQIVDLLPSS